VFLPEYGAKQRDYALKQFQRQFEILLALSGLGHGTTGEPRSMYSLRHTSIMYRLLYGGTINTLTLPSFSGPLIRDLMQPALSGRQAKPARIASG